MSTRNPAYSRFIRSTIAVAAASLAAAAATSTAAAPRAAEMPDAARCADTTFAAPQLVATHAGPARRSWTYGWPVKPFDRQHPVRAFLNDPRIGSKGGTAFHFGIDVAAPDGTPVYAVEAGKVYFSSAMSIAVESADRSHEFGYWHIVPVVKSHQLVAAHQLLGRVGAGWGHVHFAERRGGIYVNPLRPGGLGPYVDRTAPAVDAVGVAGGRLVVAAHDTPDPRVPGPWADEPVTPALLRWRVAGTTAWRTAVDFRAAMLDRSRFGSVYTPRTRQNHEGEPGLFCFYLAQGAVRPAGDLQVEAADASGNRAVYSVSEEAAA